MGNYHSAIGNNLLFSNFALACDSTNPLCDYMLLRSKDMGYNTLRKHIKVKMQFFSQVLYMHMSPYALMIQTRGWQTRLSEFKVHNIKSLQKCLLGIKLLRLCPRSKKDLLNVKPDLQIIFLPILSSIQELYKRSLWGSWNPHNRGKYLPFIDSSRSFEDSLLILTRFEAKQEIGRR